MPASVRRATLAKNVGFQRACVPLGPLFNIALARLPTCEGTLALPGGGGGPRLRLRLDALNAAGALVAFLNLAGLAIIRARFVEPADPAAVGAGATAQDAAAARSATAVETADGTGFDSAADGSPARPSVAHRPPPLPSACEIVATLRRSGAWVSFGLSFQNNWANNCVSWSVLGRRPILLSQLYSHRAAPLALANPAVD